jgi:hypothetical protein
MVMPTIIRITSIGVCLLLLLLTVGASRLRAQVHPDIFATSEACMACHNGLIAPDGEDISIGTSWRATMMANSARDPYWQAAVRREVTDHPSASAAIQNECSRCHMPMATHEANLAGQNGEVFARLPAFRGAARADVLAADGVSCTTCHQITDVNLGSRESFVGRFGIDTTADPRSAIGPYDVHAGLSRVMESSSGYRQRQADHIQSSELCATCHTLFTHSLDANGEVVGEFPEQVPYLEWLHSEYAETQSCQSCHMTEVEGEAPISSVLGTMRTRVSRHRFNGGNFFMARMLNQRSAELAVQALPHELSRSADQTLSHLGSRAAQVELKNAHAVAGQLSFEVFITNLAGHKLPTAYPSRRTWIHVTVNDDRGQTIFESGATRPDGSIVGNDNDLDGQTYEPHYSTISDEKQVQIYEAILGDPDGRLTTGLLTATQYLKDNRILPAGFDKNTAETAVEVHGRARHDPDFSGGHDSVTFELSTGPHRGPFDVYVEVLYQPIGYRWAHNLAGYGADETDRFVEYYEALSHVSSTVVAASSKTIEPGSPAPPQ